VIPTRKDVGTKKLEQYLEKFKTALGHERAAALLDQTWLRTIEAMPKAEIAGRFLALSYQDLFIDKPEPKEIPREPRESREPRRGNGPSQGKFKYANNRNRRFSRGNDRKKD
jgi:hypothetical protein